MRPALSAWCSWRSGIVLDRATPAVRPHGGRGGRTFDKPAIAAALRQLQQREA
jgi:hypothetical protein